MLRTRRSLVECSCVMIMIKCLHRYWNGREDNGEGEGEVVLSHFVTAEFHQAQKGTRNRHHLVPANLTIEGTQCFVYLKTKKEGRTLTNDNPEALWADLIIELSKLGVTYVQSFGATRGGGMNMDGRKHGWEWAPERSSIHVMGPSRRCSA